MTVKITTQPLTKAAFARFGDVIETSGAEHFDINDGMATRYHDLAAVDAGQSDGRPAINIFHGRPWAMPLRPKMMERHSFGSQAFVPLSPCRWLVIVAPPGEYDADELMAFHADGGTGANYRPGVWHHPLVVLDAATDFLVVDRIGSKIDCDIVELAPDAFEILPG